MKKTTSSRKQREKQERLSYNIRLALAQFTAIMMGEPDKYKTINGGINYYPSDCLNYWRYSTIDKDGQTVNDQTKQTKEITGIICEGRRYYHDDVQQITVMFKAI